MRILVLLLLHIKFVSLLTVLKGAVLAVTQPCLYQNVSSIIVSKASATISRIAAKIKNCHFADR
jgi:hypothetical protein